MIFDYHTSNVLLEHGILLTLVSQLRGPCTIEPSIIPSIVSVDLPAISYVAAVSNIPTIVTNVLVVPVGDTHTV